MKIRVDVAELLREGLSDVDIARRLGIRPGEVRDARRALRLPDHRSKRTGPGAARSRDGVPRADIVALLGEGLSNTAISRRLGCDRHRVGDIRRELDLPNVIAQPLTLEQKWRSLTRPLDGGHLEWCGERVGAAGTPVMHYKERSFSPAGIAFTLQHGRQPEGQVKAECGVRQCVAPAHVEDGPGRRRLREQLRRILGGPEIKTHCVHGHDLSVHGRFSPNGRTAYCEACKAEQKQAERTGAA